MKIGVISDTHGSLYFYEKALKVIGSFDYIIHCGDVLPKGRFVEGGYDPEELGKRLDRQKNIFFAQGNGDAYSKGLMPHAEFKKDMCLSLGKHRIFVTHGHLYSKMSLMMKAKEAKADIVCYGHTHVKELAFHDEMLVLNPGSTTLPRDGSRSCAVIEDDSVSVFDIITGEVLGKLRLNDLNS